MKNLCLYLLPFLLACAANPQTTPRQPLMTRAPLAHPYDAPLLAQGASVTRRVKRVPGWSDAEHVAHDELLQSKAGYLNTGFFSARALIIFGIWSLLALFFARFSRRQDATGDQRLSSRMIFWAGSISP